MHWRTQGEGEVLAFNSFKCNSIPFEHIRVNPEHKSCFKCVFCFNLRSFRLQFCLDESVMCPLTRIIKNFFNRFFNHFLMSTVQTDVKSPNADFG